MVPMICINNLGPVAQAELELKPLTILVGPNSSGKSHVALTVYAISQALRSNLPFPGSRGFGISHRQSAKLIGRNANNGNKLRQAIKDTSAALRQSESGEITFDAIPESLRNTVLTMSRLTAQRFCEGIDEELRRCFGSNIQKLARRSMEIQNHDFEITLTNQSTGLSWGMRSGNDQLITTEWNIDLSKGKVDRKTERFGPIEWFADEPELFLNILLNNYMAQLLAEHAIHSHYLPATRSGILQGHKTLASLIVDKASRAWIEPLDIPKLPGVTTDLIRALLRLGHQQHANSSLRKIVKFLESEITEGFVGMDSQFEYPDIYYENDLGRFELHNVSSMISEIAPLVLFLKFLIQKGELLIFEEPESHLDPSNQRNVARAIAMLVKAGVKVIVTTHSDIFLNQISNLVKLGHISPGRRRYMGYKAMEVLNGEDIAAYLFKPNVDGTRVEPVEMDAEYGISTESSDKIHRALYEEAIKLEHTAFT